MSLLTWGGRSCGAEGVALLQAFEQPAPSNGSYSLTIRGRTGVLYEAKPSCLPPPSEACPRRFVGWPDQLPEFRGESLAAPPTSQRFKLILIEPSIRFRQEDVVPPDIRPRESERAALVGYELAPIAQTSVPYSTRPGRHGVRK
jgi:hypothetical protein